MKLWSDEFVSENIFSKYCSFDSLGDVKIPKLGQKGPKLVFHVPTVVEKWKSIIKENLRQSIRLWYHYLKSLKFWLPQVTSSTQKWVNKIQISISCANVDRKMKLKSTLLWGKLFIFETAVSKFWSFDSTWWRHQPKTGSKKCPNLYLIC